MPEIMQMPAADELLTQETGFDYGEIEIEHRAAVKNAAQEIRGRAQTVQDNIILIGRRLLEVKALLPHGKFGKWRCPQRGAFCVIRQTNPTAIRREAVLMRKIDTESACGLVRRA